jgi:hypothetical protein
MQLGSFVGLFMTPKLSPKRLMGFAVDNGAFWATAHEIAAASKEINPHAVPITRIVVSAKCC